MKFILSLAKKYLHIAKVQEEEHHIDPRDYETIVQQGLEYGLFNKFGLAPEIDVELFEDE